MSMARTRTGLFLFKNETHNHPTEIEPFGGAATCGAVPSATRLGPQLRVSGHARHRRRRPHRPGFETLEGKLPQRKIVTTAAAGYSSLRQPDRPATGRSTNSITRLRGQAHGGWRRGGRYPGKPRSSRVPRPQRQDHPAGRPHRP